MVTEETLAQVPEEVRLYLRALRRRILELERTDLQQRIAELEAVNRNLQGELDAALALLAQHQGQRRPLPQQRADATAKRNTNSSNSSLPPSSDRFHVKRRPPAPAGQPRQNRSGQPGPPRQQRLLVPADQVRHTLPCKPTTCRRCGQPLTGNDANPLRHQVAELPVVVPDIVEYQRHRLRCPCCPTSTCGTLPPEVQGQFGPRREATLALRAGRYRQGLRPGVDLAAQLWGLAISTGMVSKLRQRTADALLLPWFAVLKYVRTQHVNSDETPWREHKKRASLWAVVTPLAALFRIAQGRTAEVAQWRLGQQYAGGATCDRLKSSWWIKRLQGCWAHGRRDFQAMMDRGQPGQVIGQGLLEQSNRLFHLWHQFGAGQWSRRRFQKAMQPVRAAVAQWLQRGQKSQCRKTAGTCKELLGHEEWLWTFVDVAGVQPTNNEGERAERPGVLLRKTSGGTDSRQGSRFVARVLTVVDTCRRQGKKVPDYLSACIGAWRHDQDPPSLVPNTS